MTPNVAQFLDGMARTMERVILPALTDQFAKEQAKMTIVTLRFLKTVHDKEYVYELIETTEYANVLRQITSILQDTPEPNSLAGLLKNVMTELKEEQSSNKLQIW